MDRSLDEVISERQRTRPRGGGRSRGGRYDDRPRDTARKPPTRDSPRDMDKDVWIHDRYDDDNSGGRDPRDSRDRRNPRIDRYEPQDDGPFETPAKLRVDNLHYDLTETDLRELFTRIGPITTITILYDRSDRSRGTAYVTYASLRDAHRAIREFDGANAYGQPIKLTLMPSGPTSGRGSGGGAGLGTRIDGPPGRSLFDRIENGRAGAARRGRSESPARDRRSEVLREDVPDGIDRYVPGGGSSRAPRSRSPLRRGAGRRGASRREDAGRGGGARDRDGRPVVQGRPRKTAEELDAEMENYWGGGGAAATDNASGNAGMVDAGANGANVPAVGAAGDDDIDMIE